MKSSIKFSREALRGLMIDKLYEFVALGLHDSSRLSGAEVAILPQITELLLKYDPVNWSPNTPSSDRRQSPCNTGGAFAAPQGRKCPDTSAEKTQEPPQHH